MRVQSCAAPCKPFVEENCGFSDSSCLRTGRRGPVADVAVGLALPVGTVDDMATCNRQFWTAVLSRACLDRYCFQTRFCQINRQVPC